MKAGKGMSGLAAGSAHRANGALDPCRSRHLRPRTRKLSTGGGVATVLVDEAESPLAWLARRQGRNGRALIAPHQFLAGERLRADFTRAQMMPRTTSNWDNPIRPDRSGPGGVTFSDVSLAARQRVRHALQSAGPEFSGLLLDVCCFLKRLEDIERERVWPARSAKVVLQLALDRLARHYGLSAEAVGKSRGGVRTWLASDAEFWVDCV
ncbi:MAG: hypothetical protein OJF62_003087 [Pseudolabrys sp.]|jgi:hypothetical protein|nr:hypothetical protein [Pseudolabrys sp.]